MVVRLNKDNILFCAANSGGGQPSFVRGETQPLLDWLKTKSLIYLTSLIRLAVMADKKFWVAKSVYSPLLYQRD